MADEKKYFVKGSWIFNLEAMHDKLWCLIYDAEEGKVDFPIVIAGRKAYNEADIADIMDEASRLEWAAKSGRVTDKQYGRIKAMVEWRVMARYTTCMAAGMDERRAGVCFADM